MGDAKRKARSISAVTKPVPTLSDDQLNEILFPDISKEKFTIGGQTFRIRVLPWKWERLYRKEAMPVSQAELLPFERAIKLVYEKQHLMRDTLGLTESFVKSEVEADGLLTECVVIICTSQDTVVAEFASKNIEIPIDKQLEIQAKYRFLIENADDFPESGARAYLREIIRAQSEKLKLVHNLGESLMARFGEIAALLGTKSEFDSLKRDLSQQALTFMAKVGRDAGIPDKSSLPSTESGYKIAPPENKSPTSEAVGAALPATAPEQEQVVAAQ